MVLTAGLLSQMEIIKKETINFKVPSEDYPYSASAKIFHTDQLFLYKEKVAPGKRSSAPHYHKMIDEIIFVVKGELYAYEGEDESLLLAGDSVCFKANSQKKHYLENRSVKEAEFLLFRKSTSEVDTEY